MAAKDVTQNNAKAKTMRVWMWNITEPRTDFLQDIFNLILILSAIGVVIGTVGSITLGKIKQQFLEERIQQRHAELQNQIFGGQIGMWQ